MPSRRPSAARLAPALAFVLALTLAACGGSASAPVPAEAGAGCTGAAQCASGQCVDGVCCETACGGTCEACNLPGRLGHCDPVPDGEDPAAECAAAAPATCAQDGACSGGRACRRWAAGTTCQPAACLDGTSAQPAAICDGQGTCAAPPPVACAPLTCDPSGGACRTTCADASQCAAGYACAPEGGCLLADGQACAADAQCLHGFCTDGVCCEGRCGGTCEACDQAGRAGFCDPVAAGSDPAEECADTAAATCGTTGACSGARACAVWPGATTCGAAACASVTTSLQPRLCDGSGACSPPAPVDCGRYRCDDLTGLCRLSCTSAADCAPGHDCAGGLCRKVAGSTCATGTECGSGLCVDGVCCQSSCGGTCQACNLPGSLGTCAAIPAGLDPASECADQGAASCGTSGTCDGAGACAKYSAGTTCAAAACLSATEATPPRTCDGGGTCLPALPSVNCTPGACSGGACLSTCTTPADCAPGYGCAGGTCKLVNGQACAAASACLSGFCVDGYCCNAACAGTCVSCNQAALAGVCSPTTAGQAQVGECPVDACNLGVCDGSGACRVAAAGTPCGTGLACNATGTCVDVNECAAAPCDANATCTNTVGGYTCACNAGWVGSGATCQRPLSCADLLQRAGPTPNGLYVLDPDGAGGLAEFQAYCDMTTAGGGWTVFQRRMDATDFDRTFAEYQAGFGSLTGSHWLGLDRLVALTGTARTLRVEVTSLTKGGADETYPTFSVGAAPGYQLTVAGPWSGTAGDSLTVMHNGMLFSARDVDNDTNPAGACAVDYPGGWWFSICHSSQLNGPYVVGAAADGKAIIWSTFDGLRNGLIRAEMKLR